MIYHLIEYLKDLGIDLPGQGLFSYLSFLFQRLSAIRAGQGSLQNITV